MLNNKYLNKEINDIIENVISNIKPYQIPIFLLSLNDKMSKLTNIEMSSGEHIDQIKLCLKILYPDIKFNFDIIKNKDFIEIFLDDSSGLIKTDKYWTTGLSVNNAFSSLMKKIVNEVVKNEK